MLLYCRNPTILIFSIGQERPAFHTAKLLWDFGRGELTSWQAFVSCRSIGRCAASLEFYSVPRPSMYLLPRRYGTADAQLLHRMQLESCNSGQRTERQVSAIDRLEAA